MQMNSKVTLLTVCSVVTLTQAQHYLMLDDVHRIMLIHATD
jgi:hypothetical protein